MKVRITVTADLEIDEKFIDEDGSLIYINDPAQVGGAKPLAKREPVAVVLKRLLNGPYYVAGQTPRLLKPWDIKVQEILDRKENA